MTHVVLDTRGRLIKFSRVPPQANIPAVAPALDWSPVFSAAGLDISRFTPADAQWNPPQYSDTRTAWWGVYPDQPQTPLRVEAAAYQGKPTYFALIGPWEQPAPEKQRSRSLAERISTTVVSLLLLAIVIGGLLLARYNLKQGRGDKKGAFRLVVFLLVLGFVGFLAARHASEFTTELESQFQRLSRVLFVATVTWFSYIAIEPLVRRRWPNLIISWSRLLAGNYRDPLIGRDILIGGVCGLSMVVLGGGPQLILKWLGKPHDIYVFEPPVLGLRTVIAHLTEDLALSLVIPMSILLLGLLLSIVLRKRWLAAVALWFPIAIVPGLTSSSLILAIGGAIAVGLGVMVTMRYGLLTAYFCFLFVNMANNPTTTNLSAWYAGSTIFALTVCAALILYGFYTSLAGQQLFRGKLLNE